jgi:DNA-binding MarR family transcriptional regulator
VFAPEWRLVSKKAGAREPLPQLGPTLEFLTLLWELDHELEAVSSRMKAAFGLTAQQRMLIRILGRFPGLSAGQLAELLRIHPGTLSTALARLERRGLLARRRDAGDRRRVIVALTAKGRRFDVPMRSTVESAVAQVLRQVTRRDIETFKGCLRALTEALHAESTAGADDTAGPSRRERARRTRKSSGI